LIASVLVTTAAFWAGSPAAMAADDPPAAPPADTSPRTSPDPVPAPDLGSGSSAYKKIWYPDFFGGREIIVYEVRPGVGVTSARWAHGRWEERPDAEMRPILQDYVDMFNEWVTTESGRALFDVFARQEPMLDSKRWAKAGSNDPSDIRVVFSPESGVSSGDTPDPFGTEAQAVSPSNTPYGGDVVVEGNPRTGVYYVDKDGALKFMAPSESFFHEAIHAANRISGVEPTRMVHDYPGEELVYTDGRYETRRLPTSVRQEEFYVQGGDKGLMYARELQAKYGLDQSDNAYFTKSVDFAARKLEDAIPPKKETMTRILNERIRYAAAGITEVKFAKELGIPFREEYITPAVKGGPLAEANFKVSVLDGSRKVTQVSAAERSDPRGTKFFAEDRIGVSGVPEGATPITRGLPDHAIRKGVGTPSCGAGANVGCSLSGESKPISPEESHTISERLAAEKRRLKASGWAELLSGLEPDILPTVARATVSEMTDDQVRQVLAKNSTETSPLPEFVAGLEGAVPNGKVPLPLGEETVSKLNRGLRLAANEVLSGEGLANAAAWLYSVGLAFAEDSTTLDKVAATTGIIPVVGPVMGITVGAKAEDPRTIAINSLFLAAQVAGLTGNELAALVLTVAALVVDAVWNVVDQIKALVKGDPRQAYSTAYMEQKIQEGFVKWSTKSMDTAMDGIWAVAKESFDRAQASVHWDALLKQTAIEEQGMMLGANPKDISTQQAEIRSAAQKNADALKAGIKTLLSTSLTELASNLNAGEPYKAFRDRFLSDVLTPAYQKDMVAYCEATTSGEEGAAAWVICQGDEYKKAQLPSWQVSQLSGTATKPLDPQPWLTALDKNWAEKGPKATVVPAPPAPALRDLPWTLTSPTPGTTNPVSNAALITGFGPVGRGVEVWSGKGDKICSAIVSDRGYWGCAPANPLPEGTVTNLQVKSLDGVVRASTPITIRGTALAVTSPTRGTRIEYSANAVAPDMPDWTGTGKPGASLTVFTFCGTGGETVSREITVAKPDGTRGNITVGPTGQWRYTPSVDDFTPGKYCSVTVADKALNSMTWSDFTTVPVGG
jgi:hypothetical protein